VDGKKSRPPAQYKAFVEQKRAQFVNLGITTYLGNMLLSVLFLYAVQALQGTSTAQEHEVAVSTENLITIVKYNSIALFLGGVLSYLA